jgi:prepilin-type N-terminal cleavage/methylation domain-containing protein
MMSKFVKKARRGFTLVEIMIVVLIIGILLAIAIPNFVRARNTSRAKACQANLKQIDSATEQYLMDNRTTTYPALTALSPNYLKTSPACPSGGTYSMGTASANPTCSITNNGTASDATDDHILQ